ncbi:MAG: hypothetical protein NC209_04015 [Alistipes sp.]|nr:hypothetical protein [Lachnospiraceae bacterium]MCM1250297.1 hypothetical protein [Alistipes sp.]
MCRKKRTDFWCCLHFVVSAVSIIAAIVILIILCKYTPRTEYEDLSFDYQGVIVAIFSLIVTLLVGWQIYNAVENTKMLKRMDKLESDLKIRSNLLLRQNEETLDIIEAFNSIRIADQAKNDSGTKYLSSAIAIKLFLQGKVSLKYPPLQVRLVVLSNELTKIENANNEDEKILFARRFNDLDQLYDNIIDLIAMRKDNSKKFRISITNIRDRRKKLNQYRDKETSTEKMLREKEAYRS